MVHVVFVAPRFLENTLRYVRAFAALDGVKLSVISEDPASALHPALRERIVGHYRVPGSLDAGDLTRAVAAIQKGVGPVDRLTGALEQLQMPLAIAREKNGVPGMGVETARNFRDKDRMKEVLREAGVPVAKSALVHSVDELKAFVREVGLPIVVKPQAGLGSRSTYRLEQHKDIAALLDQGVVPTRSRPLQAEEFVRAREHTCETITIHGKPVWRSGTRYFPSPLEVIENPWIQYCVLLPREADDPTFRDFDATNQRALDALGAGTALTHMEWFLRDDGTKLVSEVGARPPGVHIMPMMSIAHETDMISQWCELIAFDRFEPRARKWAAGAAFFRGQGQGQRIRAVHGVERALAEVGDSIVEARLPKVGQPRAESYEGEGWAIVKSATTDGAKHALARLITNIRVELG